MRKIQGSKACLHIGVAGRGLVDLWVVDDEKDLEVVMLVLGTPK